MNFRVSIIVAAALAVLAAPLHAACFADYKAKRDDPLQLHYGVIEIGADCDDAAAVESEARARIAGAGWELLNIVSTFDAAGLEQRRESAGEFFLRF